MARRAIFPVAVTSNMRCYVYTGMYVRVPWGRVVVYVLLLRLLNGSPEHTIDQTVY